MLHRFGPQRSVIGIFVCESALTASASGANHFVAYIATACALGIAGSLLWSAVMVMIPDLSSPSLSIDRINQFVQSVRNLGYVLGPLTGGMLYAAASGRLGMLVLSGLLLMTAGIAFVALRALFPDERHPRIDGKNSDPKNLDMTGLLRTPGVLPAVSPLVVTVIVTSGLNVLLIVYVRSNLELDASIYGLVVASLSVGLVVGPLAAASTFARLGDASGASAAAAVIGLAIGFLALSQEIWALMLGAAVIGVANGVQNTLLASFMMKTIHKEDRFRQMPAYVLILQTSVFAGFIGAGFVDVDRAGESLLAIGIVAALTGSFGVIINMYSSKQSWKASFK